MPTIQLFGPRNFWCRHLFYFDVGSELFRDITWWRTCFCIINYKFKLLHTYQRLATFPTILFIFWKLSGPFRAGVQDIPMFSPTLFLARIEPIWCPRTPLEAICWAKCCASQVICSSSCRAGEPCVRRNELWAAMTPLATIITYTKIIKTKSKNIRVSSWLLLIVAHFRPC